MSALLKRGADSQALNMHLINWLQFAAPSRYESISIGFFNDTWQEQPFSVLDTKQPKVHSRKSNSGNSLYICVVRLLDNVSNWDNQTSASVDLTNIHWISGFLLGELFGRQVRVYTQTYWLTVPSTGADYRKMLDAFKAIKRMYLSLPRSNSFVSGVIGSISISRK